MKIERWLVHTCTKKSRTGSTSKGDPRYGSAVTFSARVEKSRQLVRNAAGEQVASRYVMATLTPIADEDIVWFPSIAGEPADNTSNTNAAHTPITIEVATDKRGRRNLWQVYF